MRTSPSHPDKILHTPHPFKTARGPRRTSSYSRDSCIEKSPWPQDVLGISHRTQSSPDLSSCSPSPGAGIAKSLGSPETISGGSDTASPEIRARMGKWRKEDKSGSRCSVKMPLRSILRNGKTNGDNGKTNDKEKLKKSAVGPPILDNEAREPRVKFTECERDGNPGNDKNLGARQPQVSIYDFLKESKNGPTRIPPRCSSLERQKHGQENIKINPLAQNPVTPTPAAGTSPTNGDKAPDDATTNIPLRAHHLPKLEIPHTGRKSPSPHRESKHEKANNRKMLNCLIGAQDPSSRYFSQRFFRIPARANSSTLSPSSSSPLASNPDIDPQAYNLFLHWRTHRTIPQQYLDAWSSISTPTTTPTPRDPTSQNAPWQKAYTWQLNYPLLNAHMLGTTLSCADFANHVIDLLDARVERGVCADDATLQHIFSPSKKGGISVHLKRFVVDRCLDACAGGTVSSSSSSSGGCLSAGRVRKLPREFLEMALERGVVGGRVRRAGCEYHVHDDDDGERVVGCVGWRNGGAGKEEEEGREEGKSAYCCKEKKSHAGFQFADSTAQSSGNSNSNSSSSSSSSSSDSSSGSGSSSTTPGHATLNPTLHRKARSYDLESQHLRHNICGQKYHHHQPNHSTTDLPHRNHPGTHDNNHPTHQPALEPIAANTSPSPSPAAPKLRVANGVAATPLVGGNVEEESFVEAGVEVEGEGEGEGYSDSSDDVVVPGAYPESSVGVAPGLGPM